MHCWSLRGVGEPAAVEAFVGLRRIFTYSPRWQSLARPGTSWPWIVAGHRNRRAGASRASSCGCCRINAICSASLGVSAVTVCRPPSGSLAKTWVVRSRSSGMIWLPPGLVLVGPQVIVRRIAAQPAVAVRRTPNAAPATATPCGQRTTNARSADGEGADQAPSLDPRDPQAGTTDQMAQTIASLLQSESCLELLSE
jgi:hypothetical protein